MKAPGLAQESSCVHISRELETFVHLQEADKVLKPASAAKRTDSPICYGC